MARFLVVPRILSSPPGSKAANARQCIGSDSVPQELLLTHGRDCAAAGSSFHTGFAERLFRTNLTDAASQRRCA